MICLSRYFSGQTKYDFVSIIYLEKVRDCSQRNTNLWYSNFICTICPEGVHIIKHIFL